MKKIPEQSHCACGRLGGCLVFVPFAPLCGDGILQSANHFMHSMKLDVSGLLHKMSIGMPSPLI
ncbi:hypothetical protein BDU57DRAFT_519767 [Ampelomyces quisqualis]|uniref:Uncharacterized protein n=1 Tax=Ampelomyces quisqualis TaxID=50730 RepID=A0A6A5QIH5_AMPQU|nr:hypothetical protein BDU57DRAFT_519767 [Ampelomyces quisqualis]